jgi:hypothetical protein
MVHQRRTRARLVAGCLLFACANLAMAVGSGPKSIAKVETTDIFFTVYFSDGDIANTGCNQANKVVYWRSDFPKSLLATALTAFATGKKVEMWVNGCKASPWGPTLPIPQSIVVTNG